MTIRRQNLLPRFCAAAMAAAVLGGCVKNEEKITVHADGSVDLQMVVEGDRKDMESGAPGIAKREGWVVTQHMVTEDDGEQKVHRQAEITIPAGQPIPANYPTDDPDGEALALRHATTLEIERRADGVYYHFRRVYEHRPAAFVNVAWDELYEEYGDEDPAKMKGDEARKFVVMLGGIARFQQAAIVRKAWRSLDNPWRQDLRLAVYDAINRVINGIDPDEVVEMLTGESNDDGDSDAELDALAARVDLEVSDAITTVLRDARIPMREINEFHALLARERRRYAITDDYMDDYWRVKLEMPGTLVGHNGDKIEDGAVTWERKGEYFYDRTVELLATSRVSPRDSR